MKILYIWHAAVEKSYRNLFHAMAKDNEVALCTARRWFESSRDQRFVYNVETDKNLKIYKFFTVFLNHIRSFFYPNIFKMIYILLSFKPDVVYLKEEPYSVNAFQWIFISKFFYSSARIVVESDENLNIKHPFIFRLMEKFVLKRIDGIACVPQKGIDLYRAKGYTGKIFKTFYFYNEERFKPLSRKEAFSKLNMSLNENIYFGYAGRLTEEKGIEDLLSAFLMLFKENKNICLLIAGKGDKKFENNMRDFIVMNKIEGRIKIFGALSSVDIVYFYNCLDVLIVPSHSTEWWVEQFGRVIIEAMACGVPVIGSSSGEIPIVIGRKDFIFEEKDFKGLYEIMKKFVTGTFSREKFSKELIDRAKLFSLAEANRNKLYIMQQVLKLYRKY